MELFLDRWIHLGRLDLEANVNSVGIDGVDLEILRGDFEPTFQSRLHVFP